MLEHEARDYCGKVHGHNYRLEVTIKGTPDPISGLVFSRDHLDQIVSQKILSVFDRQYLNTHLEHTSGESLVSEWYKILKTTELGSQLVSIQLQETAKNRFISA